MSVEEENKAKQRRLFEEVINNRNLDLIPELFSPEYSYRSPFGLNVKGPEGFRQMFEGMLKSFPDANLTIEDMFAEEDKVAARVTLTATQTGDWQGNPSTGKKVSVESILIARWADGKEVEAWEHMDTLGFIQQLGVNLPVLK